MPLKFPTARLLVCNMMLDQARDCATACVHGAYEYGIVAPGSLDNWLKNFHPSEGACGSLLAAREIVEQHFLQRRHLSHGNDGSNGNGACPAEEDLLSLAASTWTEIEHDIQCYRKMKSGTFSSHPNSPKNPMDCGLFAPIVFDFVLQHISRY
ncbi:MAG TPA: hypothetical protein V6D17_22000 [Candidatus Obscuribacterales bacterium]